MEISTGVYSTTHNYRYSFVIFKQFAPSNSHLTINRDGVHIQNRRWVHRLECNARKLMEQSTVVTGTDGPVEGHRYWTKPLQVLTWHYWKISTYKAGDTVRCAVFKRLLFRTSYLATGILNVERTEYVWLNRGTCNPQYRVLWLYSIQENALKHVTADSCTIRLLSHIMRRHQLSQVVNTLQNDILKS
jgi:hypothetical protein